MSVTEMITGAWERICSKPSCSPQTISEEERKALEKARDVIYTNKRFPKISRFFSAGEESEEERQKILKYIETWGGHANLDLVLQDDSIAEMFVQSYGWGEDEKLAQIAKQELFAPTYSLSHMFMGVPTGPTSFEDLLNNYFRVARETSQDIGKIREAKSNLVGFMRGFIFSSRFG